MNVFISYASEDLNPFRIPEIANFLENQPGIQNVYYWDRDNDSTMSIIGYMEQFIQNSEILLAISSPHSLTSTPVKKETDFAEIEDKRIIPIFINIENVRPFLKRHRGVVFNSHNFDEFLDNLISIINVDGSTPILQRYSQEFEVQNLFERLKRLIAKLFDPNIEIAYIFTSKLLRSEKMQDYFGIIIRHQDYLDDQKVGFIDGLYYIIPNSKTLRIRRENGIEETLLTRNNLIEITEEGIINHLNGFFLDIVNYVREEHNIEIN
ncbi:hypothetical protein LCGC14_1064760 [marine sediment metagenome]|uniref:TIR domain-containing protein n=1 Tax=marine sediment metagenome TaxID=412755 RepID=A0A0F9QQY1_9ZZZZ|nr:toll/interleukin-1 receptor domain-containing protein [archaeon]